ncbi:uroporphyrinogen decarboxylase family protein [Dictyobacter aurantiacus]|uniref:Methylcobamide--CoM methyltransferase n=1 Tax=Dictyobacter aurantiacus TaxID=1936993 RepID=A0A401ZCP8_9CHLR|nr:uroporphyrinogen decarboxylase family protein [Dictyobacter aurantiacus]GCE04606.1 methylcobamide--CoM methyltransferase [Dictyobacter aurantiacus]
MNKKERVDAALRGEKVDRVPVSVWGHDYEREWGVQSLSEAVAENFNRYDWDYVKVNPRASYLVEGWKARYRSSGRKFQPPICEYTPITSASDWKRIRPQEPDQGALGEQLRVLQLVNHEVGYDAYFVQTIFCPLGVARYLAGDNNQPVLLTIREDRRALHTALRIITETLVNYAIACLEQGASGIFYATNGWASEGLLTQDQYREFGEQYDLEFLDAIKSRSKFNILHNCGSHIYFDLLASYPVQALSWAPELEGNPDLRDGRLRSGKAVMGGINERTTLKQGTPGQIQDEIGAVLEQTGGQGLLLAPGCAIAPETPVRNLEAIRRALS